MVNRPAQELLGYDLTELIGQPIELVLPALSFEARAAQGETSPFSVPRFGLRLELEARRRDGTTFPVELSLTLSDAGSPPLIMGRLGNLTAASRGGRTPSPRERDLPRTTGQVALMKDEFLAILAHELRMPLHSMLGWTQLIRSAPRDQEMTARALEVIERNIRWQAQAIDDLIELAEMLSWQLGVEVRPVRLTPIIHAALGRVSDTARSKGIRLIQSLDAEDVEILADPDGLEDVLWKLLSNALKFTSEGGDVEVRSQEVGPLAQITVSDTGQGIDPVLLPHIFDSVRQVDPSSRRYDGPGLGLSIVRRLVEMQGGSVHAESAGLEQGTSFAVSLPLSKGR